MRTALDTIYNVLLALAAACLIAILVLVGAQVGGQVYDAILRLFGQQPYGFLIPSVPEISGYLFGAGSFLALAATLKRGAHIRVTMLLGSVPEGFRRWLELWALAAGFAIALYATWALGALTYSSWQFGDVSSGLFPVRYWIPQSAMTLGLAGFCMALADEFLIVLRAGRPSFTQAESAITMGQE